MSKIYVYIWFDIEDYITRESDDLPLIALRILGRYNVPATCKMVAEKVRELRENGRHDVISAIADYDVGFHLDTHSQHPTIYEYLADLDVIEGAKEFVAREGRGLQLLKEVFSRTPSCFGHPGPAWAPHVYPALKEMGIPVHLDETSIINLNESPYWYCGILNLNGAIRNFILFDHTFEKPKGNNVLRQRFKKIHDRLKKGAGGAVSILFHLHTAINKKFWDEVNFADGKNKTKEEYERPPAQPAKVAERAWDHFEQLIRYISSFKDVQFITGSDAAKIYDRKIGLTLDRQQLKQVVDHSYSSISHLQLDHVVLSPAQAFYAVAASLSEYSKTNIPPKRIQLKEPLGPMATSRSKGRRKILARDLVATAGTAVSFMNSEGCMPSTLRVGTYANISPEDFLKTGCKLLSIVLSGRKLPENIVLRKGRLSQLDYVNAAGFRSACKWKVLPRNFHAPKILEQIKLQTWTLCPAKASS